MRQFFQRIAFAWRITKDDHELITHIKMKCDKCGAAGEWHKTSVLLDGLQIRKK